ncbi:hypothetical protein CATYP_06480 [Corynebacterium atypicum]|uniref:Uncharacterized protein n=1 Tax=Corynebacterium atypicum TaxID=191610 RepID=A0ABM5QNC0_9CORY|nr:hypothetical protein [Corynebacterium atypicum]AIG64313.1 hypothetical protein CATYP_06480 [Corynebacterium atypicum]
MKDINVVGTPNATEDVYHHIKPGRTRAPFLRYIRIDLPRLTKALLLLVVAVIGAMAAIVALSDHLPFSGADIALWAVVVLAVIYLAFGLCTKLRIWDYGSYVASAAVLVYIGGLFGDAPYVWNGASIELAAAWNTMLIASVAYWVLNWAVNYGMLSAWPDTQGFTD